MSKFTNLRQAFGESVTQLKKGIGISSQRKTVSGCNKARSRVSVFIFSLRAMRQGICLEGFNIILITVQLKARVTEIRRCRQ